LQSWSHAFLVDDLLFNHWGINPIGFPKKAVIWFCKNKYSMNKNAEIEVIGKPIFKQKINLGNKVNMQG